MGSLILTCAGLGRPPGLPHIPPQIGVPAVQLRVGELFPLTP